MNQLQDPLSITDLKWNINNQRSEHQGPSLRGTKEIVPGPANVSDAGDPGLAHIKHLELSPTPHLSQRYVKHNTEDLQGFLKNEDCCAFVTIKTKNKEWLPTEPAVYPRKCTCSQFDFITANTTFKTEQMWHINSLTTTEIRALNTRCSALLVGYILNINHI